MLGPSLAYPGGMTQVVRAYAAAGLFAAWPVQYIPTYAGRTFPAMLRPWLAAIGTVLLRLGQRRAAILHVHSAAFGSFWRKSVLCALAAACRVPYVLQLHDGRLPDFYGRRCGSLARAWVRAVLRRAARVVVLTARWAEVVRAIEPAARVVVIGNPVEVPAALPALRVPARQVLYLGWLMREKGTFDLVRAMPAVLRVVPQATFVFAGSGVAGAGDRAALVELARALGVERALAFPGWVEGREKRELLRASDVFVLPSYAEALPLGVLEAMAAGTPVLASAVGGIPDVIEHGRSGLLVEPGTPQALAQAIARLLTDDALRARLRDNARREVARRYSPGAVLAELDALYRSLGLDPLEPSREPTACAAS
jgi:glycosyltransferase involved in cell wall biosynthesis